MKRFILPLLFVFALSATAAAEGLYWESKTTGGPQGEQLGKSYAMPKKFKTVHENGAAIMRLDKEVMWQVRDQEKKYSEMTFAELEQMGKKTGAMMDKAMADMESQMASMPPEQREMMKKMMGNKMGAMPGKNDAPVEARNTGEKKTISSFACTKYVLEQAGSQVAVVWATTDIADFAAMRKDWEEFSKKMASLMPSAGKGMGAAFAKIDGFPIQTELAQGITTTVIKVEKRSIPAGEFEIPQGYTLEKNKMMGDMEEMSNKTSRPEGKERRNR